MVADEDIGIGSGSMIFGKRGMASVDGLTSIGGGPAKMGEVVDGSPPRFKSTGDVRRTLLVLLPLNS